MTLSPRTRLVLLALVFFLPIAASFFAYYVIRPAPTGNYGELLLPPTPAPAFAAMRGSWILVVSDAGACAQACRAKLDTISRVRLALGRNAARVQRAFVPDDGATPAAPVVADGIRVVARPPAQGPGPAIDRSHIYLIDPHGDAMMRWPAEPQAKRMLKDLERLLKASQIG